eukprot:TRINITY_DN2620_c0_g1_i3.p1 TRINITY_DN2620_c0_g1~~TRINITY_DN2620_c0_g1_i3.p1  ORF type:complete len:588 (+),score=152.08 TRINITY_DN2620_c0_g1_i3:253-2016(+)
MATESSVPGKPEDKEINSGNVADGVASPPQGENLKENDGGWPFKNSEPIREEQVQNAVRFLSHPKVRGSPVVHRRSFLERKGLTREEIDEAFRRVPDSPPNLSAQTHPQTQEKQNLPISSVPSQQPISTLQQTVSPLPTQPVVRPNRFNWKNVIIALGLLSGAGAGTGVLFKKVVIPKLKDWIRNVITEAGDHEQVKTVGQKEMSAAAEATAAAKSAAEATTAVAFATQELLKSKNEDRRYFERLVKTLEEQIEEMKSMKQSLVGVQQGKSDNVSTGKPDARDNYGYSSSISQNVALRNQGDRSGIAQNAFKGLKDNFNIQASDQGLERPSSAPATVIPSQPQHSKSYMEIMAMVSRGEKPPGIREIDDKPPNPNQPITASQLQPRTKPWQRNGVHHLNTGTSLISDGFSDTQIRSSSSLPSFSNSAGSFWKHNTSDTEARPAKTQMPVSREMIGMTESAEQNIDGSAPELHSSIYSDRKMEGPGINAFVSAKANNWVPPSAPSLAMPQAAEAIRNPKYKVRKEPLETRIEDEGFSCSSSKDQDFLEINEKETKAETPIKETHPFDDSLQKDIVKDFNKEAENVQSP